MIYTSTKATLSKVIKLVRCLKKMRSRNSLRNLKTLNGGGTSPMT
jgi:hypothetical protein